MGFPHNFSGSAAPKGKKSLYAEVSYSEYKRINKKTTASLIKKDLKTAGILKGRIKDEDAEKVTLEVKSGIPWETLFFTAII